jgi:protein-S-isoprenylcysteine O-methyltransferase Ste14
MYGSVAFVILGEAAVFRSMTLLDLGFLFFVGVNLFVLFFEEPALRRKFAAEYEEYCRQVPRWRPRFSRK